MYRSDEKYPTCNTQREFAMKQKIKTHSVLITGLVTMFAFISVTGMISSGLAHKGATGVVKKRMDTMKEMKGQLKVIDQMLVGKKPYSDKKIRQSLDYIRAHAGTSLTMLFPKGTAHKPSEADPLIWKNWEEFKRLAVLLNHSTDQFRAKITEKNDADTLKILQKEHLAIRKICKTCHDKFQL